MKIIGIVKQKELYIVKITADEISRIMGYHSIYSHDVPLEINTIIPISDQYNDVQLVKNLYADSIKIEKEMRWFQNKIKKIVELAEKLNINNKKYEK